MMSVVALDLMVVRALKRAAAARLAGDEAEVAAELQFAYKVREIEAQRTAAVLADLEADLLEGPGSQK